MNHQIQFFSGGCYHHSCNFKLKTSFDVSCHDAEISSPEHQATCDACKASKKPYDNLRPLMFKLKGPRQSMHPHKKKSHAEVWNDFINIRSSINKSNDYNNSFFLTECMILSFYYQPLSKFADYVNLTLNENIDSQKIFCDIFKLHCYNRFPLLKYPKLTKEKIVQLLKNDEIHGFLVISAKCGKICQKMLGIVHPFVYYDSNGASVSSFEIEKKMVTSNFLQFLLDQNYFPDFFLEEIFTFFEFSKSATEKPFFNAASHLLTNIKKDNVKGTPTELLLKQVKHNL